MLTTALVALAGGSAGPGRMADIGAPLLDTLVSATVAMGVGGLIAGVGATVWARRYAADAPSALRCAPAWGFKALLNAGSARTSTTGVAPRPVRGDRFTRLLRHSVGG